VRALTFNIWGIGFRDRFTRLEALCQALPALGADVVALQEVWQSHDQQALAEAGQTAGLPYHHVYRGGKLAPSGLMTLSRYPIIYAEFRPFRLTGRLQNIHEGDYFAGKGIGLARLQTPHGLLDVYNLHTLAQYHSDERDIYRAHRAAMLFEAALFVKTVSAQTPALIMGDFNAQPEHLPYRLFRALTGAGDSYAELHPDQAGYTFSRDNPYNRRYRGSERLDYVLYRGATTWSLRPTEASLALQQQPDAPYLPYSDHYGVRATFTPSPALSSAPAPSPEAASLLREFSATLMGGRLNAQERRQTHLARMTTAFLVSLFLSVRAVQSDVPRTRARRIATLWLTLPYVLLELWQALLVVSAEANALSAILDEARTQIEHLRLEPPA